MLELLALAAMCVSLAVAREVVVYARICARVTDHLHRTVLHYTA